MEGPEGGVSWASPLFFSFPPFEDEGKKG